MYEVPQSIEIEGIEFPIRNKGDYRVILDCFEALEDAELTSKERLLAALIIFYEDINDVDDLSKFPDAQVAVEKMFNFFNCGQGESPGMSVNYKLVDWNRDSQLICSAINRVANMEVRSTPYMHWWTFMGYYIAIGESSFSTIVGIRNKIAKGKKLEKYERDFKRENPQYFNWDAKTVEQKEADALVRQLWNNGEGG